jgi:hypothetical protein
MINKNRIYIIFIAIAVMAFISTGAAAEKVNLPESNRMKPDHLPTPFTAEQIRESCKGRKIKLLSETPGKPNSYQVFEFRQGDAEKADFDVSLLDAQGKQMGQKQPVQPPWKALQGHASYPKATTTLTREKKTTSAGAFDCWLYTTTETKEGKTHVSRFWFARSMPGPPILLTTEIDGKIAFKMTMVETGK